LYNADSTQIWWNNFEVECDAHAAEDVRRTSSFRPHGSVVPRLLFGFSLTVVIF
jgi:hypothetical protein